MQILYDLTTDVRNLSVKFHRIIQRRIAEDGIVGPWEMTHCYYCGLTPKDLEELFPSRMTKIANEVKATYDEFDPEHKNLKTGVDSFDRALQLSGYEKIDFVKARKIAKEVFSK